MRPANIVAIHETEESYLKAVTLACHHLSEGNIIAIPTDTIYGLATCAQNTMSVQKLYEIKGRDGAKPLAVCLGKVDEISTWGKADILPNGLLKALLPGPVTVILERTLLLNSELNPTCSKIGVRVPNHPFVRDIALKMGVPLALTSANSSNEPSSLSPAEFKPLWPHLAAVFDGGPLGFSQPTSSRAGSTVVDLSVSGKYSIVRNGSALSQTLNILHSYGLKATCSIQEESIQ